MTDLGSTFLSEAQALVIASRSAAPLTIIILANMGHKKEDEIPFLDLILLLF